MRFTLAVFLLFFLASACTSIYKVDVLLTNGTIYTVDSAFSAVEAMAIRDGKIIVLGTSDNLEEKVRAKTTIDLEGKFVYPGFIDPHCHFLGYGKTLTQVDLKGTASYLEVIERCKDFQEKMDTYWITGRGWDQNKWEVKQFPDKELLDKAFPNNPVLLRRVDGHAAIANSKALELANVLADTKVEGGAIQVINGEPTGILIDKAMELVMNIIPEFTIQEEAQALLQAQTNCFAVGLTSVGDAGLQYNEIVLIDSLQKEEELKMRIYAMLEPSEENISNYLEQGKYITDYLNIQSIKLYADGALGSRGACLLEPYSDDAGNFGIMVESYDWLKQMCELAYNNNFQVNTHCIGDSANRVMLDIYASVLKEKNDRRWRIEHAQVVNPDDMSKFGDFSIIPSIQTTHCTSDMYWAVKRLGPERSPYAYAWQDLLKENAWMPNGSDFPIEAINPLFGFYSGISRQDNEGKPIEGFFPQQRLSREQALRAMTIWAAKAQFEEDIKGSLEVGKLADFVVLPEDLLSAEPLDIYSLKVEQTYSNGELVYEKH